MNCAAAAIGAVEAVATRVGEATFHWGARTYVMGILNVTPDSFSGDGVGDDPAAAVARALQIEAEGADMIDVGGVSTRPGARLVPLEEELRRVLPALRAVGREVSLPISIDTSRAVVARAAVAAGAHLVNDVSGLADAEMLPALLDLGVPCVITAASRRTSEHVLLRVRRDLQTALDRALTAGIAPDRLILDPGFGFDKTPDENVALLGSLAALRDFGLPLLVGLSRKRTISHLLGPGRQHDEGANAALVVLAVAAGAGMVRVHDVASACTAARIADAVVRGRAAAAVDVAK